MKKLIPFIYVAMMYVTALFLGTLIHPGYLAYFLVVLLIMAVANMINAFRLNNEDNLKEMKTAMAICTFGPIPFYLFVLYFFAAVASITNDINSAAMLAVATISFIQISCAMYTFFYVRKKKLPIIHLVLPFVMVVNVIQMIWLLIRYRNSED